jgi:DNA invertase Pin-like site-specific DNA recombinase
VYTRQSSSQQVRDHTGSAAAQRDLAELPRRWGWPPDRIQVSDADLGRSGTGTSNRQGFQELLAMVSRREVGMVVVQDTSRLARRAVDFAFFVQELEDSDTLLCVNGAVYAPGSANFAQTFGLQVQGLVGVLDNQQRASRLMAARVAKARRSHAVSPPPIGYVQSVRGQWIKDSDPKVQEAIESVFRLYQTLGSLGKVVRYLRAHHLEFPRRYRGLVKWGPLDSALLDNLLRNPTYAGDYVFLRHRSRARAVSRSDQRGHRVRPASEWIVAPDHHEPYVSREVWQHVQDALARRRPGSRPMLGKGTALLQGLIRCGECHRWMRTHYWGRQGRARSARYVCRTVDGWGAETHRVVVPARFVESRVAHEVLQVLTAVDTDTARGVIETASSEALALERSRQQRLGMAENAVERLRYELMSLGPAFHRSRIDLQAKLESALRERDDLQAELPPAPSAPAISLDDVPEVIELTGNIQQLWNASTTTNEDRKRILRTVISEIIVRGATDEHVDLDLVWAGGLQQTLRALRPRVVDAVVREQTKAGKSARAIVNELNAVGTVTATGRPISRNVVALKRGAAGLRPRSEWRTAYDLVRQGLVANVPRLDLLRQLQDRVPRLGPWTPRRLANVVWQLRRSPGTREPLPPVLPAEQQRQAVIDRIEQGLAAGDHWTTIAAGLNASELRPPRGRTFTDNQLRLLYMRVRGLRSLKRTASPATPTTHSDTIP